MLECSIYKQKEAAGKNNIGKNKKTVKKTAKKKQPASFSKRNHTDTGLTFPVCSILLGLLNVLLNSAAISC